MREPADCVADAFLNLDFALSSPLHLFDNVRGHFQSFKPLLGHGIIDGLQILTDFLFFRHRRSLRVLL
jgi:hypothetical protein